mmetsp:Transcript_8898/g.7869  ORF Transcript_8898/g.7869 Transcript_8898/m.7869 type:complete len:99 (-) Transcript_8898:51-347(-)
MYKRQDSASKSKTLGSFENKDTVNLNPYTNKLLTSNPAFVGSNIPVEKYREKMPYTCDPDQAFNIWEIVKDMIGKDLAHFAVPVFLNEPLSMLQKLCE